MTIARPIILAATLCLLSATAQAQQGGMPGGGMQGGPMGGQGGGMMGPPPGAFQACANKAQGDACTMQTPRGDMNGTCNTPPNNSQTLVCMPQGAPGMGGGGQMGMPQGMPGGGQMGGQYGGQQMGPGQMGQQQSPNRFNPQATELPRGGRNDAQSGGRMSGPGGGMGGPGGGGMGGMRTVDIDEKFPGAIAVTSKVPDTAQGSCFNTGAKTSCKGEGDPLFGQDANYHGPAPSYTDHGDGTVTDNITGLVWEQAHHDTRISYYDAKSYCEGLSLGGRSDWRLPNIKELFSLSDFRGAVGRRPYINDVFEIREPDASILENDRFRSTHSTDMMGQTWSSSIYTGTHYGRPGVEAAFFYNFLDGHIKQAPTGRGMSAGRGPGAPELFYRCVAGKEWGANDFQINGDGTVTDNAMGLMWQQVDDGQPKDWLNALKYCENLTLAGYRDWRLPNVKELQTIIDYSKNDPALDQRFLQQTDGKAWFWSSTTHGDNISMASYVCFGKCVSSQGVDTHGAGAQRSDPKTGDPSRWTSLGGQEDEVRIQNAVRCVR